MTRGVTHAGQGLPAAASACLNSLPAVCIQEEEECLSARFPPRQARATHYYHCASLQSAAPAAAAYRTLKVAGAKELKAAAAREQRGRGVPRALVAAGAGVEHPLQSLTPLHTPPLDERL